MIAHPGDAGSVQAIAILAVVCFLVGIARSWELIGGPRIEIADEVTALVRRPGRGTDTAPAPQEGTEQG